jgi:hypothetical protein
MALERDGATRLVQLIRNDPADVAVMQEFFDGDGGAAFRDDRPLELLARGTGMLVRRPRWWFGRVRRWLDERLRADADTSLLQLARDLVLRRVRLDGLTLTSHHFMSSAELATETGKARLAACVFRLPVNGEMVPMCRVNAGGVRERFYAGI